MDLVLDYSRQEECWTPEVLWRGQDVFILGGGPSLRDADLSGLAARHAAGSARVIAVNSSHLLAPWADILFFTDNSWFECHVDIVRQWPQLVVTFSRATKAALPDKVRRIRGILMPEFPPLRSEMVRLGQSSGQSAISLAIAMGATRIVLLGFDMREDAGRSHHHDEYRNTDPKLYTRDFLPGFCGWDADAKAAGVEILNATPESALMEFKQISLASILSRADTRE